MTVDPGTTRVIKAPPGTGAWRLSGFDGLEISARMRVPTAAADYQGEEVPLLDSDNVHPANSTAIVQSLLAAHGYLTDFALWNASKANMRCEASVHLANGTQIGPGLRDPRRSALAHLVRERGGGGGGPRPGLAGPHRHDLRSGLLRLLAHRQSADRLSRDPHRGEQHRGRSAERRLHAGSAASTAGSAAAAEQRPAPPPPPPGDGGGRPATQASEYRRNGTFFTVTNGERAQILNMPVQANVIFSEFRVSYDFHHGGWNRGLPDGIHNCGYITRGGWSGDVFMLVTTRGPNRNLVRQEITVDLPKNSISMKTVNAKLDPGSDYHVEYSYSHKRRSWHLVINEFGGGTVVDVSGPTTGPINTKDGLGRSSSPTRPPPRTSPASAGRSATCWWSGSRSERSVSDGSFVASRAVRR